MWGSAGPRSWSLSWHHYSNGGPPQTSNLELLSTTCSVNGCDVSVLDVRKLIMLEAVMAEGSIAAAARRLQYTRSAVSQQISALEAEAG
ncbi:MAG: LysR family transcriptional regulator, partial [Trebonia sp.]